MIINNHTIEGVLDKYTGEPVTYNEVTKFYDGSAMNDSKTDGVVFRKLSGKYYKRNEKVNVLHFGADRTGVNPSDDAVQALIATLPLGVNEVDSSGLTSSPGAGGIIFFPAGEYKISSQILVGHEMQLVGENESSTIIYSHVNNDYLVKNDTGSVYSTGGFKIFNLQIDGRYSSNGSGILIDKADQSNIENVRVTHFSNNGIELKKSQLTSLIKVNIEGCGNWALKIGLSDGYPSNNCYFEQVYVCLNDKGVLTSGSSNKFNRCTFQANTTANVVVGLDTGAEPTMGTTFDTCHFEYNQDCYDIEVNPGCLQTTLYNCQFYPSGSKTKRFIRNSGNSTLVLNSGNQTDDLVINGSRSLIEQNVDAGTIEVEGGKFGVYNPCQNVVAPFYIGSVQTDEVMAAKLAFRSRVRTTYDNDRHDHKNFGTSLFLANAADGIGATYAPFTYQKWVLDYFGLKFGVGDAANPAFGIEYKGGSDVGSIDNTSWSVSGAACSTSSPPQACLIIGGVYLWKDETGSLRMLNGSFPTSSTSGKKVVIEDGVDIVLKSLVIKNDVNTPSIYVSSNSGTTGDLLSLNVNNVNKAYIRASGAAFFAGTVEGSNATLGSHFMPKDQIKNLLTITSDDATDLSSVITLINEIKGKLNSF